MNHVYGCTAFHWSVGDSVEEVLNRLAAKAGASLIRHQKKELGGLYAWTCTVHAPKDSEYELDFFRPIGVETSEGSEWRITALHSFKPEGEE